MAVKDLAAVGAGGTKGKLAVTKSWQRQRAGCDKELAHEKGSWRQEGGELAVTKWRRRIWLQKVAVRKSCR
jgi:hypothetical protein